MPALEAGALADALEPASVPPPPMLEPRIEAPAIDVPPPPATTRDLALYPDVDPSVPSTPDRGARRIPPLARSMAAAALAGVALFAIVAGVVSAVRSWASEESQGGAPAPAVEVPIAIAVAPPTAVDPPATPVSRAHRRATEALATLTAEDRALLRLEPTPPWMEGMSPRRRGERAEELVRKASNLTRGGHPELAEIWLRRAHVLHPGYGIIAIRLARSLESQGRHDEALAWARYAIAATPEVAGPHVALGRMHERQARIPDAITAYERALDLDPRERRAQRRLRELEN